MKKIAIITIFDLFNYGNRLQNYAMQQVCREKGLKVTTIVLPKYDGMFKYGNKIRNDIKKIYYLLFRNNHKVGRYIKFLSFQKYIDTLIAQPQKIEHEFEYFIVGSDQVWHPDVVDDDMMLKFTDKRKRIAISPSFGVSNIPDDMIDFYKEGLNGFSAISVREEAGKEIITAYTDVNVTVLMDPVLYLDSSEWDKVASRSIKEQEKYVLVYLLGKNTKKDKKDIKNNFAQKNIKIIDMLDEKSVYFSTGPDDFIRMIRDAELVCTNSFHAIVLSIIYRKNFVAYERHDNNNDMGSRVECLLQKYNLENRKRESITDENLYSCNYDGIEEILHEERKKFSQYINNSIDV